MSPPDRKAAPEGGWESLKVDELKDELEARGLTKSGTKAELVARLEADEGTGAGEDEAVAEEVIPPEEPAEEPTAEETEKAPAPRRGSPETGARARRAPKTTEGVVVVSAHAKYVRSAPRKARLVMDHIRGKRVEHAQAILRHAPRAVSTDILKLLNSAVANAESAYELGPDELRVRRAFVDEGPTIKRFRPRALGRATAIKKRTSHMTIELTTEGQER